MSQELDTQFFRISAKTVDFGGRYALDGSGIECKNHNDDWTKVILLPLIG